MSARGATGTARPPATLVTVPPGVTTTPGGTDGATYPRARIARIHFSSSASGRSCSSSGDDQRRGRIGTGGSRDIERGDLAHPPVAFLQMQPQALVHADNRHRPGDAHTRPTRQRHFLLHLGSGRSHGGREDPAITPAGTEIPVSLSDDTNRARLTQVGDVEPDRHIARTKLTGPLGIDDDANAVDVDRPEHARGRGVGGARRQHHTRQRPVKHDRPPAADHHRAPSVCGRPRSASGTASSRAATTRRPSQPSRRAV